MRLHKPTKVRKVGLFFIQVTLETQRCIAIMQKPIVWAMGFLFCNVR